MAYNIPNSIEYITYEVQDGDTYESIAKKFNITMAEIVTLNNLDATDFDTLYIGSTLKVGLRDKTTGNLVSTGITTDDNIEKTLREASLQTISVDSVTQETLNRIKEEYNKGGLPSIVNELVYLGELGYTKDEVLLLLNDYSVNLDLSNVNIFELSNAVINALKESEKRNSTYDDSDLSKDTILGLPFRYNTYTDPRRRVYNSTFMADASIVSIIPGRPLFRGSDDDDSVEPIKTIRELFEYSDDEDDILSTTQEALLNTDEAILSFLQRSQKNNIENGDLRYYRFKDDYMEFLKYLDLNISTLAVKMGVGDLITASYTDFMKNIESDSIFNISHAFKFFCTKSGSSTNESISNEFGDSQLAGTMNGVSDTANELMYLLGEAGTGVSKYASDLASTLTETMDSLISGIFDKASGSVKQLGGSIGAAVSGNKVIWPQIWKNSSFQRSYNFSFEFVSPYGSPEAIFRYVYLPFLTLLTLASPKQYGTNGYGSPFLIRIDMPGFCTSDLSVIQNMSWKKGGNDGLFTNDGLPLAMTVDITVQDLYPNMAMSRTYAHLRHNTGMHGFLDNLAGLTVQRFSPFENIKNSLVTRAANILGGVDRSLGEGLKSKVYSISANSIFGSIYND